MSLIFRNITVVNATGRERRDVYIQGDKIVAPFVGADLEIDGTGKFLIPGVIDGHVHFRTPGAEQKETWETGSAAAKAGGVTTVLDMPNTTPAVTTQAILESKMKRVAGHSHVNYGFHFGGSGNLSALKEARGMKGIKVYMGSSTGDLLVDEPSLWEAIFTIAKEKEVPVIVHAESEKRIRERMKTHQKHTEIRDCECARIAVEAAVKLREKVGNKLHIAHMSCKDEVDILRAHAHPDLSSEVCPHHLFFNEEDMKDGFLKMNPPLRSPADVRALWEALRDGTVTCLATDHAPHLPEEKKLPNPPAGVPGVQWLLPLMLNEVNQNMISLERLVQLTSQGPARVFGLHRKGAIEVGMDADVVMVDMNESRFIRQEAVLSKCGWTPYEGYELKGWPTTTVINGSLEPLRGRLLD